MEQELAISIIREIDSLLKRGVIPVSVSHLNHLNEQGNIIDDLMLLKEEGLISGDVVSMGEQDNYRAFRMTNIRLTYPGIKILRAYDNLSNKQAP